MRYKEERMSREHIDLLRSVQGSMNGKQFAELLGVSNSMINDVLRGKRQPGRKVIGALIRAFPEKRREIVDVYFDLQEEPVVGAG